MQARRTPCPQLPWRCGTAPCIESSSPALACGAAHRALPQETVAYAAPRGWSLAITDVSMGSDGPQLSGFRALADPITGRLAAIDCRMALDSGSMRAVVRGSGPIGAFTATVSGIRMEGAWGKRAHACA